ncbi:MAG: thioredoxin-disulfide reductase [Desulfobacterales bacterium]|nr:thioredoxin-disulfide reductase [Desulfobacterales bacterium]
MDQESVSKEDVHDVIIIGGGPAGLTAGMYTARARLSTVLIEKLGIGGQASIADRIENYPGFVEGISGPELVHTMEEQARSFGMRVVFGEVTGIDLSDGGNIKKVFVNDGPEPYQCLSIIIAAGHEQRKLGVPGEREYTGKGVSYCATCDGAFFTDLGIAVVGGGDAALEEALFLTRFAKKIYVIHRRDRLRATEILQERAFNNDKVELVFDSVVDEIFGQTMVDGVKVRNLKTGERKDLEVNGVFVSVGWIPGLSFLGDMVKRSEDGYIIVDKEMETSREGVFACGDCRKKNLRQIVTACGDGATAAFSAQHYVERMRGQEYV